MDKDKYLRIYLITTGGFSKYNAARAIVLFKEGLLTEAENKTMNKIYDNLEKAYQLSLQKDLSYTRFIDPAISRDDHIRLNKINYSITEGR